MPRATLRWPVPTTGAVLLAMLVLAERMAHGAEALAPWLAAGAGVGSVLAIVAAFALPWLLPRLVTKLMWTPPVGAVMSAPPVVTLTSSKVS